MVYYVLIIYLDTIVQCVYVAGTHTYIVYDGVLQCIALRTRQSLTNYFCHFDRKLLDILS